MTTFRQSEAPHLRSRDSSPARTTSMKAIAASTAIRVARGAWDGVAGLGLSVAALTLLVAGVTGMAPMTATFGLVDFAGRNVSWLVPLLGLSVVAAAISYLAAIAAARALGPKLSSFVGLTEVLFAAFFAWLFLGEAPTAAQMAGGALIIGGVVLVHVDEMRGLDREGGDDGWLTVEPARPLSTS